MNIFAQYAAHLQDAADGHFRPLPLERFIQLTKDWLA